MRESINKDQLAIEATFLVQCEGKKLHCRKFTGTKNMLVIEIISDL